MRTRTLMISVVAGAALLPAVATPAIGAQPTVGHFSANLAPVAHDPEADSGSHVRGHARVTTRGDLATVNVTAHGLSPRLPHVMHIHGKAQGLSECPGPAARIGGVDDGLIETVDGLPAYGPIQVSFTTSGGTGSGLGDALALDRAPVANTGGNLTYQRSFEIPSDVRHRLGDFHVVIHGEDLNDNGSYDAEPITALGAPLEAELPVACGELDGSFVGR